MPIPPEAEIGYKADFGPDGQPHDPDTEAKLLGGIRGQPGINWTWYFFGDAASADHFNRWCLSWGYETRGVYPPTVDAGKELMPEPHRHHDKWGVRIR